MTSVTAIGVDDEEYVVPNPTDRLDSNLFIFATIVRSLQCGR
jgi:hypothetical protein